MSAQSALWRYWGPVLLVILLGLDQATKWAVLQHLEAYQAVTVTSFFNLVLVWNTGVSFGMFQGAGDLGRWVLVGVAALIAAGLLFWLAKEPRTMPRLAIWMVLTGAIGNVIDRLRFGAVVDFLDFHWQGYHWPAFNVADSCIVVGAVILLVDGLFLARPATHQVRKES